MPPEAGQESIGVVLAANGEVYLRSESGVRQVESGADVFRGEELVTGAGSTAEIRFVDDTLLSQGADSVISLDDYVYDDSASDAELLFKMSQGTFRLVTGKIAEQNPDRFQVGTPLATIGIRGTTIVSQIAPGGEQKIGVEEIHAGKALLIQSISGEIRMIANPRELVDIAMSGQLGSVRPMTSRELSSFRDIAPSAIRQEQEIQQQREQEQQERQDDPDNQDPEEQGQEAQGGEGEPQGDPEGGETGGPAIPGQGVLDPGIGVVDPAGALAAHQPGLQAAIEAGALLGGDVPLSEIEAQLQGTAGQIFGALNAGDLNTAQQLLNTLQSEIDDIIDELIGNGDTYQSSEGSDAATHTSDDGTTFILGGSVDNTFLGTTGIDYYDGQGGNDYIRGAQNNDVLHGGPGEDAVYGDCGDDTLVGGADDDTIYGGTGQNYIDGGDGFDTVSVADLNSTLTLGTDSVYINLADGGCGCPAGYTGLVSLYIDDVSYETFVKDIEAVIGSNINDHIIGNDLDNDLFGGQGADILNGGGGLDKLEGGAGADKFTYTSLMTNADADNVVDFTTDEDKFSFKSSAYSIGSSTTFVSSSDYNGSSGTGVGADTAAQFVFYENGSTKQLWYDEDGASGAGAGVLIANLTESSTSMDGDDLDFSAG